VDDDWTPAIGVTAKSVAMWARGLSSRTLALEARCDTN
jgi:hypothetical protein